MHCFRPLVHTLGVAVALQLSACGPSTTNEVDPSRILELHSTAADSALEWRAYLGDKGSSQYSPLRQIHRGNVDQLREAWRYDAGGAAANGTTQMQTNPLVVKGVLYGMSPHKHMFALDAATGEELWRFESADADLTNRGRGLVFWESGQAERKSLQRVVVGIGNRLYSLDALTGKPDPGFGEGGYIDLRRGLDRAPGDIEQAAAATPGVLYDDLLIQGISVSELAGAAPGYVRAFHMPSGELRWTFRTIPKAGEFGGDTWPSEARENFGGANSWAGITLDEQRGLAFVPTGSAAFDFFGAERQGDNLFANSLVALNAATGERVWHYQMVRHDLWDRDLPAPPNLITLRRNGENLPAVSQATKSGHLFIFHRETGEPLYPIEEVPVSGNPVPGEHPAATQPLPLLPPPFSTQRFAATDRDPAARAVVQEKLRNLQHGGSYLLPSEQGSVLYPGMDGGAEWGGQAYDAASGLLYVNSNEVPYLLRMVRVPDGVSTLSPWGAYVMVCASCHGLQREGDGAGVPSLHGIGERYWPWETYRIIREGRGRMPTFAGLPRALALATAFYLHTAADGEPQVGAGEHSATGGQFINAGWSRLVDHEGLPASKPPWGKLSAIDVNRAEIAWQIPLGDMPEMLQRGITGLGAENYGGPVVTAGGLLFIAATPDSKLRAFDKATGELLWETQLPAAGFATPAVYQADGRQFLVIAAGGGKLNRPSGSTYIAFALPRQ